MTEAMQVGMGYEVARYTSVAVNGTESTDFTTLLHPWVMAGVRGAFDL